VSSADIGSSAPYDERRPLQPGPPLRIRAWLPGGARLRSHPRLRPWMYVAWIAATLALGTWGFRARRFGTHGTARSGEHSLTVIQSLFRAVKLFALDIGPAASPGTPPNWQIGVAGALAALLVLRALFALAGDRLRQWVGRRFLKAHVIVCGGGVHGSRLAQELSKDHDVVVIDRDADAPAMNAPLGVNEWRVVGDAVQPHTLLSAGVKRANWVVAVTGNDFVNSQVVSAIQGLFKSPDRREAPQDRAHVLVQVEDPSLARFLEEAPEGFGEDGHMRERSQRGSERTARPVVTPFSANAIAAENLLTDTTIKLAGDSEGPLLKARDGKAPHLILAGDHPLLDAIVLGGYRRWRVRILRDQELQSDVRRPPLRISLYGPGAESRVERLRHRWRPESFVLDLEARDIDPTAEGSIEEDDWLQKRDVAGHAIVACEEELEGVRMTLAVRRALGESVLMTRITTQPESVLDERLRERRHDLAAIDVRAIADLSFDLDAMGRVAARERLIRALVHPPLDKSGAEDRAAKFFAQRDLGIHSDPAWRVSPREIVLLRSLVAPVPVSALLRAGLAVNVATAANLRVVAERLTRDLPDDAFAAWCEYARRAPPHALDDALGATDGGGVESLAHAVLRLRKATLDSQRRTGGAHSRTVAVFAGAADSMTAETRDALRPILRRSLDGYTGTVISGGTSAGVPGLVGEVARELGLQAIGYAPSGRGDPRLYPVIRETHGSSDFSIRDALAMWSDLLGDDVKVGDVHVVVCPGGVITREELLLARALGARVAWIDPADDADMPLEDDLPFDADDIWQLPADPMTLRAFLRWRDPPDALPDALREELAKYLHNDYRRKQRGRKPTSDPSMAPWEELLPYLQLSNLLAADDIPNKLAVVEKRLSKRGNRLRLTDDEIERLAEIEHGRWNLERLTSGWQLGERRVSRRPTPYLAPWTELNDDVKEYDRESVRNIGPALEACGWGVVDA